MEKNADRLVFLLHKIARCKPYYQYKSAETLPLWNTRPSLRCLSTRGHYDSKMTGKTPLMSTHHSGSTGVMSIRGGAPKGKDVGLGMTSLSGVRDLSPWRHDSGGSCRLPEKRRLPRRKSTPRVQDGDVKDSLREQSEDSLLSWEKTDLGSAPSEIKQECIFINMAL